MLNAVDPGISLTAEPAMDGATMRGTGGPFPGMALGVRPPFDSRRNS